MKIDRLWLVTLPFLLCGGCNHLMPKGKVLQVSELVGRSSNFDGQRVTVRGWIEIEPETFRVWSTDKAMDIGLDEAQCIGVDLPKAVDREAIDRTEVLVSGLYIADVSGRFIVLGGCRSRRFVLAETVVAVPQGE